MTLITSNKMEGQIAARKSVADQQRFPEISRVLVSTSQHCSSISSPKKKKLFVKLTRAQLAVRGLSLHSPGKKDLLVHRHLRRLLHTNTWRSATSSGLLPPWTLPYTETELLRMVFHDCFVDVWTETHLALVHIYSSCISEMCFTGLRPWIERVLEHAIKWWNRCLHFRMCSSSDSVSVFRMPVCYI
jgi:trans-aconitate methyltransferase